MSEIKILGPFLCRPAAKSMGFWFCAGLETLQKIEVLIKITGSETETVNLKRLNSEDSYNVFLGETKERLSSDTPYEYSVRIDGKEWLPPGLTAKDLKFMTLSDDPSVQLDFVLMSCHGIEAYENEPTNDKSKTWDMWKRLDLELEKYPNCRLGILGGDQVYMDDTFKEDLKSYDMNKQVEAKEAIRKAYFKYWEHTAYRKVMARLPCYLMWDDHDIIDGWGSREEAIRSPDTWTAYGKQLTSAFAQMQAARNPISADQKSSFSFLTQISDKVFVAFDLRKNRKIISTTKSSMMGPDQKAELTKAFSNIPKSVKQIFLISPVTVARMGGAVETFLGSFSNFLWSMGSKISYGQPQKRAAIWALVSGFLYFGLHFNTPNFPAIVQSLLLLLISTFLLLNLKNVAQYFPKNKKAFKWVFLALAAVSTLMIGVAITIGFSRTEGELLPALLGGAERAFYPAWDNVWLGLSFGALAFLSLVFSKVSESARANFALNVAGIFFLVMLFTYNFWLGLPGWKIHWYTIFTWPALMLLGFFSVATYGLALLEVMGLIDKIAGLDDDIRDGWSSEANFEELEWLSSQIVDLKSRGVERIFLLCGDIHTGGISSLEFKTSKGEVSAIQITSSPMSYVTMPHLVEKITSGTGAVELPLGGGARVRCKNIFFRSYRNFAIVRSSEGRCDVDFHYEDLEMPVSIKI